MKLFKGNIIIEGYKSPFSLMDPKVATYGEENVLWTEEEAAGFARYMDTQQACWLTRHIS